MIKHIILLSTLLMLLTSCLLDSNDDKRRTDVIVSNYSLEKIRFSGGYRGTVDKDAKRTIRVELNKMTTATGETTGKTYGTRTFTLEITYDWVINR